MPEPNKSTLDKVKAVLKALSKGASIVDGCAEQEISRTTFYAHIKSEGLTEELTEARKEHNLRRVSKASSVIWNAMGREANKDDRALALRAATWELEHNPVSPARTGGLDVEGVGKIIVNLVAHGPGEEEDDDASDG